MSGGLERRRVFVRLEVAEERRVLGEQCLDLAQPDGCPVLDPALGEVVLDVMQSTVAHGRMIGVDRGWVHGPDGSFWASVGLIFRDRLPAHQSTLGLRRS